MDCFNMFTGEGNKSNEDPDGRGNNGFRKQMSALVLFQKVDYEDYLKKSLYLSLKQIIQQQMETTKK